MKFYIPYNSEYRPSGFYQPKEVADKFKKQGAVYKVIYKDYVTELPIAKDFFNKVAPYTVYDKFESISDSNYLIHYKDDYEVLKIPFGRIYSNNIDYVSIITSDNKLVNKFSYQFIVDKRATIKDHKILKQWLFIPPVNIDGNVFSLLAGFGATHNIAHWFFDSIPRIHLLKESGMFEETNFFIVPRYIYDYHIDSLNLLGIDKEKVIVGKEDTHIIAKNLIVSSHPRGDRSFLLPLWITQFLRTAYLHENDKEKSLPKRVFISRKDSKLRQITNEDELVKLLKEFGFETVLLSRYPLLEKIKLFFNAEIIVSASGAGLTSLFFGDKKSAIVEIFPEGFVFTHYYNIAYHVGMSYFPLICKTDKPAKDMVSGQLEDMHVDIKEMKKILLQILN
jgi:capsular polysaccharide biosynthesis protein